MTDTDRAAQIGKWLSEAATVRRMATAASSDVAASLIRAAEDCEFRAARERRVLVTGHAVFAGIAQP